MGKECLLGEATSEQSSRGTHSGMEGPEWLLLFKDLAHQTSPDTGRSPRTQLPHCHTPHTLCRDSPMASLNRENTGENPLSIVSGQ